MLGDFNKYASDYLKIMTKEGGLNPLSLNNYQKQLSKIILSQQKSGKPVRIIVLKARQIGISTYCSARIFHPTATSFYKRAQVVADDTENTSNLFNMCKRYYQFLPDIIKPMKRYSNEKALVFENPSETERHNEPGLLSSISLQSSNKLTAGRSGTINYLHLSEVAFWSNAGTTLTGLMQSVPYDKDSMIFIESTANGISGRGEEFYLRWKQAETGDSDFTPVFFPWYDNPEYEIPVDKSFQMDSEERDLAKMFNLTPEKVAWRRYKIRNEMGSALLDPKEQFMQEYPSTPEEAFIISGRTVFNGPFLKELLEKSKSNSYDSYEIE